MTKSKFLFTEQERQRIKEAVAQAEKKTAGEIVPYFVDKSDDYDTVPLQASLAFIIVSLFAAGVLSFTWALPFPITPTEIIVFTLLMGVAGFLLFKFVKPFKRMVVPKALMQECVEQKALIAFLEEEVFNTENRTGILLFVSHFEHIVEVIGDTGINAKVKSEEWQEVVQRIIRGIKEGHPVDGLVEGIHLCGELLERAGVNKPPENPNELRDDIRLG